MKVTDAMLEHFARSGLEAVSETFNEDGRAPNAVMLINEKGEAAFVEYPNDAAQMTIGMAAWRQRAVAAVMVGEAWFREMSRAEHATARYVSLADDPLAGEEVFALGMRAGSVGAFRAARQICRHDDGTVTLVDRQGGWIDGELNSWLLDVLNKVKELSNLFD